MNKRQKKKLSRRCCPYCRQTYGIWIPRKLSTGRWVSDLAHCDFCSDRAGIREIEAGIELALASGWKIK